MPDKTDKPSNQVLIQEIIQEIQLLKKDTATIRNDLAYIKETLILQAKEEEEATMVVQPISKGWW
tara:strand:- start:120 stop:314 length:195 start_codon:yes stop_codon:yes gene_type:complete